MSRQEPGCGDRAGFCPSFSLGGYPPSQGARSCERHSWMPHLAPNLCQMWNEAAGRAAPPPALALRGCPGCVSWVRRVFGAGSHLKTSSKPGIPRFHIQPTAKPGRTPQKSINTLDAPRSAPAHRSCNSRCPGHPKPARLKLIGNYKQTKH